MDELAYGGDYELDAFCSSNEYFKFKIMEFGFKTIPSAIFFITGSIRYLKIRDIGQVRVVFSRHFKTKFYISLIMAIAYVIYTLTLWATPPSVVHSGWINRCDEDYYSVFYAI